MTFATAPESPLRFAMLTTFYPPYNFGGDGIGIQRLCRGLARRGHDVTVIQDIDAYRVLTGGDDPDVIDDDGVRVHRLSSRFGRISTLLTQQTGRPIVQGRRIRKLLEDGDFDVVNFHNISLVGGPGLLVYGDAVKLYMAHEHWLVCPSHVLWRHGRERCTGKQCLRCVTSYRRPPQLWRSTGFLERQAKHVDAFIAMSEFSRRKHAEFGFSVDMEVVPYFLPDLEESVAADDVGDSEDDSPHGRPYFLFVGRLEKIKGLDDVIPAFRSGMDIGADLVIAGDGDYRADLERLANGNPRVRFLGRLHPDDLSRWYRHARALVVPSICFETFGIILIEAFRSGTPVIARRLGPFPEIVEAAGAGELFETEDELIAALRRLSDDDDHRDRLAAAGPVAFANRWSESVVVPKYLDVVRRAAERRGDHDIVRKLEKLDVMKSESLKGFKSSANSEATTR